MAKTDIYNNALILNAFRRSAGAVEALSGACMQLKLLRAAEAAWTEMGRQPCGALECGRQAGTVPA